MNDQQQDMNEGATGDCQANMPENKSTKVTEPEKDMPPTGLT